MCELFAVSSDHEIKPNEWLKAFFTLSNKNPHGWGMAMFYGSGAVALEKEPVRADRSRYLKERLRQDIYVSVMLAHIREATIGTLEYSNTHPFVNRDSTGRCWTLIHNGTIFESAALRPYVFQQEGETDSERILCYIIDQVNWKTSNLCRPLTEAERCALIDEIVRTIVPGNKLNLLLFDGEVLYAHTNLQGTLYWCESEGTRIFATVPFRILGKRVQAYNSGMISRSGDNPGPDAFISGTRAAGGEASAPASLEWHPMPFMTVCAYRGGVQVYQGEPHTHEYHEDPEKMRYLHRAFAGL